MNAQVWALTFGIAALVFWQPGGGTTDEVQALYRSRSRYVCCAPPQWLFGIVWALLYGLLTANLVIFANNAVIQSTFNNNYLAAFVLALVNLALAKLWLLLFNRTFTQKGASFAFLVIMTFLVFATALALLIVQATCGDESVEIWWVIAFFLGPYVLWTFYATLLMAQFACCRAPDEERSY